MEVLIFLTKQKVECDLQGPVSVWSKATCLSDVIGQPLVNDWQVLGRAGQELQGACAKCTDLFKGPEKNSEDTSDRRPSSPKAQRA